VVVFCKPGTKEGKQSKGTEGVITSATIGRTIFRSRKFCCCCYCCRLPGDLYIFVCARFLSLLRKLRFWIPRQESTALWSLRMCVKISRGVVVGRKKMMVLCIGNTKELLLLRSSSSAALLAHAFLLPQFL